MSRSLLIGFVAGTVLCAALPLASLADAGRTAPAADAAVKSRLVVLTDITSLSAGVREPDDGQSLIRLLVYANDIDLEGLIASSGLRHGQVVRPELLHQAIEAYAEDLPNLRRHDPAYPDAETLHALVKAGQPAAGPALPVHDSVGEGKDTDGSRAIVAAVDRADPRPLWIAVWGGAADLAQALWSVRATRDAERLATFVSRLRIDAVYDQDSTGSWIREQFPTLHYIVRHHGIRGMYRGGDPRLVDTAWVEAHVKGHGALGRLYPVYSGGDVWSGKLGEVRGIKEGDTPSFLGLIPNGLNAPLRRDYGGWGGRFTDDPIRPTEAVDPLPGYERDPHPAMAAIYRWRAAWQADFAARMDWCRGVPSRANHPPQPSLGGHSHSAPVQLQRAAGEHISLSAAGSRDPDGDALSFAWWVYTDAGGPATLDSTAGLRTTLNVPADAAAGSEIHVILEVTDDGQPALTRYQRMVVAVR